LERDHVLHNNIYSTTRTPPAPTPIPYTTLFRSSRDRVHVPSGRGREPRVLAKLPRCRVTRHRVRVPKGASTCRPTFPAFSSARPDRQSTRLNSSHVSHSYAVFCLK